MRLRRRGAAQEDVPSLEEVRSDRQGVAEHYRSTRIVRRRSEGQRARAASCSLSLPLLAAPVSSHSLLARARGRATLSLSGDTLSGDTLSRRARARAPALEWPPTVMSLLTKRRVKARCMARPGVFLTTRTTRRNLSCIDFRHRIISLSGICLSARISLSRNRVACMYSLWDFRSQDP